MGQLETDAAQFGGQPVAGTEVTGKDHVLDCFDDLCGASHGTAFVSARASATKARGMCCRLKLL